MSPRVVPIGTCVAAGRTVDLAGARILLVDDTVVNLKVLRETLEVEGFQILVATDGQGALKLAATAMPDLILMDIQMPGMNGLETCRRLKADAATREIPVVFVTGRAETEWVIEGFRAGGLDYIVKPFQSEEVLIRVQTHLKIDWLYRELDASNHALAEANQRIREAADRKARFLADMSHEIRTPLAAICGYMDNMLGGVTGELTDRQRNYLSRVRDNAAYMSNLVEDILNLSRIEAGRMEVHPDRVGVEQLVHSCCEMVRPQMKVGVALRQRVDEGAEEVTTDEAKLRQILINLLTNAAKHTEAGEVSVKCRRRQTGDKRQERGPSASTDLLEILVSDTGIGIPVEAQEAIFKEFWQVEAANKAQKGSGLGLAITQQLVHLLGGRIGVASEVGKGSTFTVRIPTEFRGAHEP